MQYYIYLKKAAPSRSDPVLPSNMEHGKSHEFHKLAIDELNAFDYEAYKANGFKLEHLGDYPLELMDNPNT